MTFVIKIRGAGGSILCDFECPVHGRFEAMVPRDASDTALCPAIVTAYDEDLNSTFECACDRESPWAPTPIHGRVKLASVTQGKPEKPPAPGFLDTRELGEGMDHHEWAEKRAKFRDDRRKQELKELMS